MDSLASLTDLDVRGVDITDSAKAQAMLDAASSAIREAAGTAITLTTSTITVPGGCEEYLTLPGTVRSVASVTVDGTALTVDDDYTIVGNQLWRFGGWLSRLTTETSFFVPADRYRPTLVTVTYTHGLDTAPADIVDLCCDLATAGMLSSGPADPRVSSESVDDYRVSFTTGPEAVASVFELPERTKASLRQRFGSQAFVTR